MASGRLTHYVGFQNDVTKREEAHHLQTEIQQRLVSTLARMTDGFVSFDQDWNFNYINPAAAALSHGNPDALVGQHLLTVFPTAFTSPIGEALQQAKATGTVQHRHSFVSEIGRWLEATVYPATDGISLFLRDVTQQQEAQTELWEGEERFEKVFQASPIGILVTRCSDETHLDANPEFLRQSGYDWEDVIGRTSRDLNFWGDAREREAVWQLLRQQGSVRNRELKFRVKSSQLCTTIASMVPVMIGGEACVITLILDMTAEKLAQQQLEASEQRYRRIATELQRTLDLSLDLVATIDQEGRFVTVNAASEQILGYAPEELIDRPYLDFVHPEDYAVTSAEEASIVGGQPTTVFQNRYLHRDGRVVWLEWGAVVMPEDRVMYCVARDVTQRRLAEEDQAFLAAIVGASQNAIIGLNLDGAIRSWNPGAERLYGYPVGEVLGQPTQFLSPLPTQAQEEEIIQRAAQGEHIEPFEVVNVSRDGRQLMVTVTISAILDSRGKVIGVARISRDITARHLAEQQIQALNEDLQRQVHHVTGLREIDQAIAAGGDLAAILGLVLDNICEQLGADAATALVCNTQTLNLEYVTTRGIHAALLHGLAERLDHELASQVMRDQQPLVVPDLQRVLLTPDWLELFDYENVNRLLRRATDRQRPGTGRH